MQYRKFGKTGCTVSGLGFGAMRMPVIETDGKKSVDEEKAIEMIRYAIDSGVNYVDTAYFYHDGQSESVVGKALQDGYREKTYIATKLPMGEVNSEADFDRLLNTQLERLQTDHVDFYLFHALNKVNWEKVIKYNLREKMKQAKADGRIRHIGFSFHDDLDVFCRIIDEFEECEFCQIQFSYLDTDYQAGIEGLRLAGQKGLGLVIMEPLRGGLLANPSEEILNNIPKDKSPVEAALSYVWDYSEVSLLLSGMGNLTQISQNISYADKCKSGMLTNEEKQCFSAAKKAYDKLGLIPCTGCLYCKDCPKGINIPEIFAAFNLSVDADRRKVKEVMPDIEYRMDNCIACHACEKKCPQNIKITEVFKRIKDSF